jgi:two-component system chemotaxis response regulator CheY
MPPVILIIDDFASVRLYHVSFLGRKGYQCLEAASGIQGLELLRHHQVDLVILDIMMPEMDGRTFIGCLAAEPRLAHLPVLVISSEPVQPADLGAGTRPLSVLAKPVMPALLLQHVQQLLASAIPAGPHA